MKRIWQQCDRRKEVSLLAAGALLDGERLVVEQHLAGCGACQSYYNEIKATAAPLVNWDKNIAPVEVTPAMRSRWAKDVQTAAAASPISFVGEIWRELIWPCRRAWIGLAAVWLVLFVMNFQMRKLPTQMAAKDSPSSWAAVQSWEEQTRILAELTGTADEHAPVVHAVPAAKPAGPRSERKRAWQIV